MGNRGDQKKSDIRQSAYRCFRQQGYHATTVDAICKDAGISKGSFYWHYESKHFVFLDILDQWSRQVMAEIIGQFEEALALQETDRMTAVSLSLEREFHRGRAIVPLWLEFSAHAARDAEIQASLGRFYRRARAAIAEMLRPVVQHALTEAELQGVAATIFGAYIGLMIQELSDPDLGDATRAMQQFMSALQSSLPSSPSPSDLATVPATTAATASTGVRAEEREIDDWLHGQSRRVRKASAELREMVLSVAPRCDERIIRGWKVLAYDLGGLLFHIKPKSDEVLLAFYDGAQLEDPLGLLEGSGKGRRHVVVSPDGRLPVAALRSLLMAALGLREAAMAS